MKLTDLRQKPLDFWVKYLATALTLLHVYLTAHDVAPWYKVTGLTVALLWSYTGHLWKEPSMIFLNLFLAAIYVKGILGW
jgi:hypothetical protein